MLYRLPCQYKSFEWIITWFAVKLILLNSFHVSLLYTIDNLICISMFFVLFNQQHIFIIEKTESAIFKPSAQPLYIPRISFLELSKSTVGLFKPLYYIKLIVCYFDKWSSVFLFALPVNKYIVHLVFNFLFYNLLLSSKLYVLQLQLFIASSSLITISYY